MIDPDATIQPEDLDDPAERLIPFHDAALGPGWHTADWAEQYYAAWPTEWPPLKPDAQARILRARARQTLRKGRA